MTKQIREYLEHLRLFLDGEHSREEYVQEMKRLHVRIGFFSHERLVHMFIMLAFAIFFLMTLFMALIQGSIGIYVLALLFLVLLIPYINCLLYTSPSPRDMRRTRMPSSA